MINEKKNIKLYKNIENIKKVSTYMFKFFINNIKITSIILHQPFFLYFNYIFKKNLLSNNNYKNSYILNFNRSRWHYSISLSNNGKTVFFFSLGTLLKHLNIDLKSLRRSKKGFLILLNIFFSVLKKYNKYNISVFFNFFDYKLLFFKKKINKVIFNNCLIFKICNFTNFKNFKKSKSIKKRLTKKFIKRISI